MTTTPTSEPMMTRLAKLDAAGLLESFPALRLELSRLRAESAHQHAVADELARAEVEHAERIRRAKVQRVTFPTSGTGADALIVSLRGTTLARETIDGAERTYELSGAIGYVAPALWERLSQQILASLDTAHRRQAGEPEGPIVVLPSASRADLMALLPDTRRPMAMSRETLARALGDALPLSPEVVGWFRAALERGGDVAAREFCRVLYRRFRAAGKADLLGDAADAARAA